MQDKEAIQKVLEMNKKLLDTIYESCKTNADIYGVDYVPLSYLKAINKMAFDKLKQGMENGMARKG